MIINSVFDKSFSKYGQVLKGYDFSELLSRLVEVSEKPLDKVIYIPSCAELEELPVYTELRNRLFGGMDIDLGYCNGNNTVINCLEYHRGSELQLAVEDTIIPLGQWCEVVNDWQYDISKVDMFFCPGGTAVELSPMTLHDTPFSVDINLGFRMIIALPHGTNFETPSINPMNIEDKLLSSRNSWILRYPDADEVISGATIAALRGKKMDILNILPFQWKY